MRVSGMGNPQNIAAIGSRVQVGTKTICLKTHIHQELRALEHVLNRTVAGQDPFSRNQGLFPLAELARLPYDVLTHVLTSGLT